MQVYHVVVALLLTLICLGNVDALFISGEVWSITEHWPIYLIPKRFFVSLSTTQLIVLILILVLLGWDPAYFLKKWLLPRENETINISRRVRISAVLIAAPLIVLCIRGGWQMPPMNESLVYFPKNPFLNQAAINLSGIWVMMFGQQDWQTKILFIFCGWRCRKIVHQLYNSNNDSFPEILTTKTQCGHFILESHTAGWCFFTEVSREFLRCWAANDLFLFRRFIQAEHERIRELSPCEWMACHTVSFHYASPRKISTTASFAS